MFPQPVLIVGTYNENGNPDAMNAAWGTQIGDRSTICCTMENQRRVDERLPVLLSLPLPHKEIIVEPMLGPVDFQGNLNDIACVTVGGESGRDARPCRYDWVLDVRRQCIDAGVHFHFMQTGACFIKDGKTYHLTHGIQMQQARKANIDY